MDAERCETCRFWRAIHSDSGDGHCRRYPPARTGDPTEYTVRISHICEFPFTVQDEWCGEFSPATALKEAA